MLVIRSLGPVMSFPGCIMLHVCQFNILSVALYNFVAYVSFPIIAFFFIYFIFIFCLYVFMGISFSQCQQFHFIVSILV